VTPRTDPYALGCILFEVLSGNPPFRGKMVIDTCSQHLTKDIPSLEAPVPRSPGRRGARLKEAHADR
jgi:serine/threonine protein kinase